MYEMMTGKLPFYTGPQVGVQGINQIIVYLINVYLLIL